MQSSPNVRDSLHVAIKLERIRRGWNAIFPLDTFISQFAAVTLLLVSMWLFTLDPPGTQHVHGQRNHFDHDDAPSVRLRRVDEQRWMGEENNAHDHSSKPTRGTESIFLLDSKRFSNSISGFDFQPCQPTCRGRRACLAIHALGRRSSGLGQKQRLNNPKKGVKKGKKEWREGGRGEIVGAYFTAHLRCGPPLGYRPNGCLGLSLTDSKYMLLGQLIGMDRLR